MPPSMMQVLACQAAPSFRSEGGPYSNIQLCVTCEYNKVAPICLHSARVHYEGFQTSFRTASSFIAFVHGVIEDVSAKTTSEMRVPSPLKYSGM